MATRFYLLGGAPQIPTLSPAFDSGWEQTGNALRRNMTLKLKIDSITGALTNTPIIPITTTQDILSNQWVSSPIPAQTISGTFSLILKCLEGSTNGNATLAVVLRVMSNDGSVSRGTLFSVFGTDTE